MKIRYKDYDEKKLELFIRDILAWTFGTVRRKDDFNKYISIDHEYDPVDELVSDFIDWFYRLWNYYEDPDGEVVDCALSDGNLAPLWLDWETADGIIPEKAYAKGNGVIDVLRFLINMYMESYEIPFTVRDYYGVLTRLELKHGNSPVSRFLWDGSDHQF